MIGVEAQSVQWETPEEKEANLRQQATGGLFQKWTFDQDHPGSPPAGFVGLASLEGPPGQWTVQVDAGAPSPPNVVRGLSRCALRGCYQLLVAQGLDYEYPDVTVRFRAVQEIAGFGGLVFGARDAENFYAAVVDPAGPTVQVVRVVAGDARVLAQAPVALKSVEWHTIRVQRNTILSKDFIETFVDGSLVLSVEDQTLGLGKVGLVIVGESSLLFDTLHAIPLFSHRPLSPPPAY
jgi:hypothetical protein